MFDALLQKGLTVLFQKSKLVIYAINFMMLCLFYFGLPPEILKCWTRMRKITNIGRAFQLKLKAFFYNF